MRVLFEVLLGISKTGIYVFIAELFLGRNVTFIRDRKVYLVSAMVALILSISNYYEDEWLAAITPFVVLLSLTALGKLTEGKKNIILSITSAIESYVVSFWFSLVFIVLFGMLSKIGFNVALKYDKYIWVIAIRVICLILIWTKYEWLQKQIEKTAVNVMILIGAFFMFFQQFFQMAYIDKN